MSTDLLQFKRIYDEIKGKMPFDIHSVEKNKIKSLTESLLDKNQFMYAISIIKLIPDLIDTNLLISKINEKQPLLLDELFDLPNIDKDTLRFNILSKNNIGPFLTKVNIWYSDNSVPLDIQKLWSSKIYKNIIFEVTDGPSHKRELSLMTGNHLLNTLNEINSKITEISSILSIFRASHYVVKNCYKNNEIHHQLPDNFPDVVLSKFLDFYENNKNESIKLNLFAFLLNNKESYPDAIHHLVHKFPNEALELSNLWNMDSKEITKYLNSSKKELNVEQLITTKGSYDLS